jgi:hypothetical protein
LPPQAPFALAGRGTAVVDGVLSPGEWDAAATVDFQALLPFATGGGTTPARLYVMNNAHELYLAVRFERDLVDSFNAVEFELDNDDDCIAEEGNDLWTFVADLGFFDTFRTMLPPCPQTDPQAWCGLDDDLLGGTNDGAGAFHHEGGFSTYEVSHPLDSGDAGHDLALAPGDTVGMFVSLNIGGQFTGFPGAYLEIELTGAGEVPPVICQRRNQSKGPKWKKESYFPSFPATQDMLVLPVVTALHDQPVSWQGDWRISDSMETMDALTLVGMQGVINRETPCVYLDWYDPPFNGSKDWLPDLGAHVTLHPVDVQGADAIDFLYQRFADRFTGAVLYDPQIADTINVATMIAGLEDRVILAPEQLGRPGIPAFTDIVDLRNPAQAFGWQDGEAGKLRLYQWVYQNLWPRLDRRILGVISPGPPTSRQIPGISNFNPLGIAGRDYLIALRAAALWLTSFEPDQRPLYRQFLAEAHAPIAVTGGDDEEPTVRLVSDRGDWEAALHWPNAPLSAGNLTALASVDVPVAKYVPALDPARILATLGDAPLTALFSSDGDNLQFQWERGFSGPFGFQWEQVQGHRFAWTTNSTLADLAPLLWNHFVNSADRVTFIGGLSGAGYMYPGRMSREALRDYLFRGAAYLRRTGLRVVQIDSRDTRWADVGPAYNQRLHPSKFLGAFFGFGGAPVLGLNAEWAGGPAPALLPTYLTALQSSAQILAELPGRRPDDVTLRFAEWPHLLNNVGEVVPDPSAPGGRSVKFPATTPGCCIVFRSLQQRLAPGTYTATFTLKVAANDSTSDLTTVRAAINRPPDFVILEEQTVRAADFTQADAWQAFSVAFTLADVTPDVDFWIEFFPGVTDLYASELRLERVGGETLPVVAPIHIQLTGPDLDRPRRELPALAEELEALGVRVLTPDELMAALNPEYMLGFAVPRLGARHPAVLQARAELAAGRYYEALLTIRAALRED